MYMILKDSSIHNFYGNEATNCNMLLFPIMNFKSMSLVYDIKIGILICIILNTAFLRLFVMFVYNFYQI